MEKGKENWRDLNILTSTLVFYGVLGGVKSNFISNATRETRKGKEKKNNSSRVTRALRRRLELAPVE